MRLSWLSIVQTLLSFLGGPFKTSQLTSINFSYIKKKKLKILSPHAKLKQICTECFHCEIKATQLWFAEKKPHELLCRK